MPGTAVEQKRDVTRPRFTLFDTDSFQREMDVLWSSTCEKLESGEGRKSFLVAAASKGEGCTTLTMGLGRFVAENTNKKVLLVDAQLEDHHLGELLSDSGLTPMIDEPSETYAVTFREFSTSVRNLSYLRFENPKSLETLVINNEDFAIFLDSITKRYDYIFFDAPPILLSNVGSFLARHLDRVIFVLAASSLSHQVLQEAVRRLEPSSSKILGAILNKRQYVIPAYLYRLIR